MRPDPSLNEPEPAAREAIVGRGLVAARAAAEAGAARDEDPGIDPVPGFLFDLVHSTREEL
jgi:hypothetical protein